MYESSKRRASVLPEVEGVEGGCRVEYERECNGEREGGREGVEEGEDVRLAAHPTPHPTQSRCRAAITPPHRRQAVSRRPPLIPCPLSRRDHG